MNTNRLTLLGMSGVGKTHLATMLSKEQEWFHYSGDYRIGSHYLNDVILQNIKHYMQKDEYLVSLLESDSLRVENNITFDNLSSVSNFLGKVGNPNIGGLPLGEFTIRQGLHLAAEKQTMLDVGDFITKAERQGVHNFINDAGGSLCELDDDTIYNYLADQTLIVYIKPSEKTVGELIQRAESSPKPLYYNAQFLKDRLATYLQEHGFDYVAQIHPDEFVRYIFPHLVEYRMPKYQRIADTFGVTINADDMYLCKNSADFFALITESYN